MATKNMAENKKEIEIGKEILNKITYNPILGKGNGYCAEDILTGIKLGIVQGSLSKEKEVLDLNNKIKGWEELFEQEQVGREQAQEEVRDLKDKLENKEKDVLEIIENMPVTKRLKDGSQIPFKEEVALVLTAFKSELKKRIENDK